MMVTYRDLKLDTNYLPCCIIGSSSAIYSKLAVFLSISSDVAGMESLGGSASPTLTNTMPA